MSDLKNLNDLAKTVYENNKLKGFWDTERETGTILMLMVSELAEALEADRKEVYFDKNSDKLWAETEDLNIFAKKFEENVKDTFEDEIADTFIRLLDLCGAQNIDIEWHIIQKIKYNTTREKKHGKKY